MTTNGDIGGFDAGGKIVKMEVDYSTTCDEKIPMWKSWASKGRVQEAIDQLLSLEKQTRTGADMASTSRILMAIVQIFYEAKNWTALNDHIVLLSKRRSQLKQAVVRMVQECCTYVDKTPDKETKIKLIETLRTITEGKIYVEVERARLTHILAKIREEEGNVAEAAKIIQELQVETYGSMDKREKVELILEQMRLCLAIKDYIRTQIISKKINTKFFEEEDTQKLKEKFYRLMIAVDQHNGSYLSVCRHFRALGTAGGSDALIGSVVFLILAPYDNEQADLTHRLNEDKELDKLPEYKQLLGLFINPEIIRWNSLCTNYEKMLKSTHFFDSADEKGQERWNDLKNRVVEHNIRIMSMYYTRITLRRMSELLGLGAAEAEEALSQLVVSGVVRAKIDRPAGIVHFRFTEGGRTTHVGADGGELHALWTTPEGSRLSIGCHRKPSRVGFLSSCPARSQLAAAGWSKRS
ncbi:26S proteasome non-ATPase regulatory subunit 12 [Eumeta japonica]|uniref:26S proteasome non-ATPase regulatory subunit 12 n=1 Tax=Eumeta variegata TaxID=151549 RepID=A0A4C1V530_EUMVA|nr:26S proteasome non-ATPase regulatory subunit 12 [Eumeta japonica]